MLFLKIDLPRGSPNMLSQQIYDTSLQYVTVPSFIQSMDSMQTDKVSN